MFSSQWFLTLFTAKFPLSLVYHVLDWFLMEGPNVIYRISLAMLRTWRRDLLALDFEGIFSRLCTLDQVGKIYSDKKLRKFHSR